MIVFGCYFLICVSAGHSKTDGPTESSPGHSLVKTSLHASMKNKRNQNDKLLEENNQTLNTEAKVLEKLCLLGECRELLNAVDYKILGFSNKTASLFTIFLPESA